MKKIYLFCSQGMSTSMLASIMQNVAEAHAMPIEVYAYPHGKLARIVSKEDPSCVLLGPQVTYLFEDTKEKYKEQFPVGLISSEDYGMMNGEKVLKQALLLMKKFKTKGG